MKQQELVCFSQNHRMSEVERDHFRSSGLTSLLKLDPLEHTVQGHVQSDFEYLQRMRLHNLSGQPVNFCENCKPMNHLNNQAKSNGFLVLLLEERPISQKKFAEI